MLDGARANGRYDFVLTDQVRVLVVDDDPILREFAVVYLSTPTMVVETAENAEEGLGMLVENGYDIILSDIDMPGMGGIAMVRAIRSTPQFSHLPIVMVTGCEDVLSIDRAYDAGATSFVTKPVNWRVLSYHLRFVLRAMPKAPAESRVEETHGGAYSSRRLSVGGRG